MQPDAAYADHIRKLVDQAPPLTTEQRDKLAGLLQPAIRARQCPVTRRAA